MFNNTSIIYQLITTFVKSIFIIRENHIDKFLIFKNLKCLLYFV